jgi:ABC-type cobalamin transport system ATPase subunit
VFEEKTLTEYEQKRLDLATLILQEAPLIADFAQLFLPDELENLLDALMESKALAFLEGRYYQMVRITPPLDQSPALNLYDKEPND